MKNDDHLPLYGPGPAYVLTISVISAIGVILSTAEIIPFAQVEAARLPLKFLGILLVIGGVALWVSAAFGSKLDDNIKANTLVTDGVYGIVRNPIYSAFMFAWTGLLLFHGNLWLLLLFPAYWIFMTVLMKRTEERWLHDLYGREYDDYCKRVNRCIPWFPKA